ncbi:MAG: hypothetical protein NC321_10285 [Clostridium sp.]|nr:hypothetical protein [Clostridium sp.]
MFWRSINRIYGFHIYPDEFGYWVSAAAWNGYDWSGVMATSSMYYSFGYSLILTPILRFSADSVQAYRMAVAVNMLFQCISIGLLWGIITRLYEGLHRECASMDDSGKGTIKMLTGVGVAVLYPVWTFYTQTTLSEALLSFLYLFICWQMLRFLEKPGMIKMTVLSVTLAYLYFVHMRTLGVVLAAVVTLLFYGWKTPECRKKILAGLVIFIVSMGIGLYLQNIIEETAYIAADAERMAKNSYAGHLEQLKAMFTLTGIIRFLQSCEGKLYYLGMASFGLFYPAAMFSIKRAFQTFRGAFTKENCFYFFLSVSMAGQFAVTAIATGGSKRLDFIIYGRYNEYFLPVFIAVGLIIMMESGRRLQIFFMNAGISTILFLAVLWQALHNGNGKMVGSHAAALNYLSNERYGYEAAPEFCKAYGFGIFLMFVLTICIVMAIRFKKDAVIMGVFLFIEVLLSVRLSQKYIDYSSDLAYYNLRIYDYINDYAQEDGKDIDVYYLDNGRKSAYVGLFQFALKEKPIAVIKEAYDNGQNPDWTVLEQLPKTESFLIADKGSAYLEKLEENYTECVRANHYVLFLTDIPTESLNIQETDIAKLDEEMADNAKEGKFIAETVEKYHREAFYDKVWFGAMAALAIVTIAVGIVPSR